MKVYCEDCKNWGRYDSAHNITLNGCGIEYFKESPQSKETFTGYVDYEIANKNYNCEDYRPTWWKRIKDFFARRK